MPSFPSVVGDMLAEAVSLISQVASGSLSVLLFVQVVKELDWPASSQSTILSTSDEYPLLGVHSGFSVLSPLSTCGKYVGSESSSESEDKSSGLKRKLYVLHSGHHMGFLQL